MTHLIPKRVAIIDLGSNTARLIIMQAISGYSYRLVDEIREVVRLRQGMTEQGMTEAAIKRALLTLRLFKRFCDSTAVDHLYAVATSAVRDAANGPAFIAQVRDEIGLNLQIIDGETEAEYGVIGVLNELPMADGYVLDIGGGSAQLSRAVSRRYEKGCSMPLGSLALTESFVNSDPIKNGDWNSLQNEIAKQLKRMPFSKNGKLPLAGMGGSIRNLADIEIARMGSYPLNTLHGFELSRASVQQSLSQFRELPLNKRQNIRGLKRDRADIILAGTLVADMVMDYLAVDKMTISLSGVREGVFFKHFWDHLSYPVIPDVRHFSVVNMARNYDYHPAHANHVRYLSTRLFDQLAPLHGMGEAERDLLAAGALLHDLGTVISYTDHHKHSQTLIVNGGLPGYTPRETAMIALLARYHRKGNPDAGEFGNLLSKSDVERLGKLAALLRLAEYLERGRAGLVSDVSVLWDDSTLRLTLYAESYPAVELWAAQQSALPLLEDAYGRTVEMDTTAAPIW